MIARADALAALDRRHVRRRRRRRRDHRRRGGARRRHARLQRRARREGRLRVGHVEPLVEARPRRPALPAELRPRPRARGAARAPAAGQRWRRTSSSPLPLVVPAFDGARPDRLVGVGLNLYDVMSVDKLAPARRGRDTGGESDARLEPGPPPHHHRRRGRRAAARARRPRADVRLPVLRLPDRRRAARADRAGRGRALRRGLRQRLRGHRARRGGRPRRAASACATALRGERVRRARRQRRQRDRRLGRPPAPRRAARRGRGAAHPPEPRHAHHAAPRRRCR